MHFVRLRLKPEGTRRLVAALKSAEHREIGGQLFGEQHAPSDFVVTNIVIQEGMGSVARFFVDLILAAREAARFFDVTGHHYTRYNYIGEWHSHPSFALTPSNTDIATMQALVTDPDFRGSFAVLMIVRLTGNTLGAAAWAFDPDESRQDVQLELESA